MSNIVKASIAFFALVTIGSRIIAYNEEIISVDYNDLFDMAVNPNEMLLALATQEELFFVDLESYELVSSDFNERAFAVSWSPDGTRIAVYVGVTDNEASVVIWNFAENEFESILTYPNDSQSADKSLSWSPDNRYISLAGGWQNTIWDIDNGEIAFQPPVIPDLSVPDWYFRLTELFAWSPDGQYLATPDETVIRIWDSTTWEEIQTIETELDQFFSLDWSENGFLVGTGAVYYQAETEPIVIVDVQTWELFDTPDVFRSSSYAARWSPNGINLAVSSSRFLNLWSFDNQEWLETTSIESSSLITEIEWVTENVVVLRTRENTIELWDIENECLLAVVQPNEASDD
jgi:WD40 repeat protein